MQIVFDARPLQSASRTRGIGRFTFEVLAALGRRAPDLAYTFLIVPDQPRPALPKSIAGNWLTYPARIPEQLRGYADAAVLRRLIGSTAADLYYSPEYGLPRGASFPAVITVHDLIPWVVPHSSYLRQRVRWAVQRRLLPQATRLLCDSNSTKSSLVGRLHIDESRSRVIYPGVSEVFFAAPSAADVTTMRARYGAKFALFVGECDWRKRPEDALTAIAPTEVRLLIVGANARHARRLRRLTAQAGVADRVVMAGFLSERDLVAAYAAASVFLFPSRYEGFGLPLLEAAAVGVPAIAYINSSIPEAAGAGTRLVPDGDVRRFAAEANAVLNGDGPPIDLEAGRQHARQFTWDRTADQMLSAFREVA